ncbi:LPXTG cell wall anchor domain-containing protein [Streptococcus sp. sy004]|nr:LPXTG cell wall anchor domain-containing protein [Streptococcus sp. sy004]
MGQLKELVYDGFKKLMLEDVFSQHEDASKRNLKRAFERANDIAGIEGTKAKTDLAATSVSVQFNPKNATNDKKDRYTVLLHTFLEENNANGVPGNYDFSDSSNSPYDNDKDKYIVRPWEAQNNPLSADKQKFDTTPLVNGTAPDTAKLAEAQKKIDEAKSKLETAQQALSALDTTEAQNTLLAAQAELLKNQEALTKAENELQTAKENVVKEEESLAQAQDNEKTALNNLSEQQEKLSQLIVILDEAKVKYATAKDDLVVKQEAYDVALLALKTLEAPTLPVDKVEEIVDKQTPMQEVTEIPTLPVDKVEEVVDKQTLTNETTEVPTLPMDKVEENVDKQMPTKEIIEAKVNELTNSASQMVEKQVATVSKATPESYQSLVAKVEQTMSKDKSDHSSQGQILPNTGDDSRLASVVGMSLLAMAGGMAYKRKED